MTTRLTSFDRAWTASELRRLSPAERDDILAKAAALAECEYRSQPHLTDFEAFGEDDLVVDYWGILYSHTPQGDGLHDDYSAG